MLIDKYKGMPLDDFLKDIQLKVGKKSIMLYFEDENRLEYYNADRKRIARGTGPKKFILQYKYQATKDGLLELDSAVLAVIEKGE